MNDNRTPVSELGKFGLIDYVTRRAGKANISTVTGPGDDAAVLSPQKNRSLVSTDMLLEGIHFSLVYSPLKHLGYKAVIRGISDICAMNATPEQIFISLGISSKFFIEQIDEIFEGIDLACKKYNVDLAGGDITSSLTGLIIGVTATGSADKHEIVLRNGAGNDDLICVTGDFGAAYIGLQVLERERRLFETEKNVVPDLTGCDYVVGRQLKPDLPVKVLDDLKKEGIRPTALMDVTDGLASDIMHICKSSAKGCRIYYSRIPVDYETSRVAGDFNIDPVVAALNGGDDYEFLFTVPLSMHDKISKIDSVKIIGHMTEPDSGMYLMGDDGSQVELTAQGWKK